MSRTFRAIQDHEGASKGAHPPVRLTSELLASWKTVEPPFAYDGAGFSPLVGWLLAAPQAGLGHLILVLLAYLGTFLFVQLAILVGVVFLQHFLLDLFLFIRQFTLLGGCIEAG